MESLNDYSKMMHPQNMISNPDSELDCNFWRLFSSNQHKHQAHPLTDNCRQTKGSPAWQLEPLRQNIWDTEIDVKTKKKIYDGNVFRRWSGDSMIQINLIAWSEENGQTMYQLIIAQLMKMAWWMWWECDLFFHAKADNSSNN